MNQEVLTYFPLVAPVATLVVVVLGVSFQNRHIDVCLSDSNRQSETRFADMGRQMEIRFADMSKLITSESAWLEAVLKLDLAKIELRVKGLEDRAKPALSFVGEP